MDKLKRFIKQFWYVLLLIIYIISPVDLVPEIIFGFIGYLDDFAVFVALSILLALLYATKIINDTDSFKDKAFLEHKKRKVDFEYEDAKFTEIKD